MSFEGNNTERVTSKFELNHLVNWPTRLLERSSLCVDLKFTSQPNLEVELNVHPFFHPNCHHQVVFANSREVWHYRGANTDLTRRAISTEEQQTAFYNTNFNNKVSIFNKTVLNVLHNHVPHETILCSDKNSTCFNFRIKSYLLKVKF